MGELIHLIIKEKLEVLTTMDSSQKTTLLIKIFRLDKVQELTSKSNRFVKVENVIKTIEEAKEVKHVLVEYVAKTMEMEDQININHQEEDKFNLEMEELEQEMEDIIKAE